MRQFLESKFKEWGERTFTRRVCALIEDKESDFSDKLRIRALWEAIGEPNFKREMNIQKFAKTDEELTEALDSSVFPKITATLISKFVQEGYDLEPGVGFAPTPPLYNSGVLLAELPWLLFFRRQSREQALGRSP